MSLRSGHGGETVENDWFVATFPGKVERTEDKSDPIAAVVEYAAEMDPFGVFSIRVTNMRVDPFLAVGASKWIADFGDRLVERFKEKRPEVFDDKIRDPAPGLRVRDLMFRFDYEGPCGCFARVMGIADGDFGRILEATAIVEWNPNWEAMAFAFLDGIKLAVAQPTCGAAHVETEGVNLGPRNDVRILFRLLR